MWGNNKECCIRRSFSDSVDVFTPLDGELCLRASAASMGGIGVTGELDRVVVLELKALLEPLADLQESLLALLLRPALALLARDSAANGAGPEADTVEASPNVDDNTHDLIVLLVFEVLANGSKHDVQPQSVNVDSLLLLELESPLATVLVLGVFPLRTDALLE